MNTNNLKVLPLREIEDKNRKVRKQLHPNLPKIPFLCSIVGATGTGKSVAISNMLLNKSARMDLILEDSEYIVSM
mgnify:CR=1 FL=1